MGMWSHIYPTVTDNPEEYNPKDDFENVEEPKEGIAEEGMDVVVSTSYYPIPYLLYSILFSNTF